jgi:hypothetical protein
MRGYFCFSGHLCLSSTFEKGETKEIVLVNLCFRVLGQMEHTQNTKIRKNEISENWKRSSDSAVDDGGKVRVVASNEMPHNINMTDYYCHFITLHEAPITAYCARVNHLKSTK